REFVFFDQRCVLCDFERAWISHNAHTFDQRIPKRHRGAEAVKERERSENSVILPEIEQVAKLGDISDNVAMTEDRSLRIAGAPAGKEEGRFRMATLFRNLQKLQ